MKQYHLYLLHLLTNLHSAAGWYLEERMLMASKDALNVVARKKEFTLLSGINPMLTRPKSITLPTLTES
jgi:hypothetical protein